MSTWSTIVDKAFPGNKKIKFGNPDCILYGATPNAAVTAPIGTLCWDTVNEDAYINTDGSTAWTVLNA